MKKLLSTILFLLCISFVYLTITDATILSNGEVLTESIETSKIIDGSDMHYYEINIPANWKQSDLIIDSKLMEEKDLMKSPYVIVSLEPLEKNDTQKQWVCNQLGEEVCFLPAKYMKPNSKVYLGVFCKKCEYNLKYNFSDVSLLKLGDTKMFHLKSGDTKIFDLVINNSNEFKDYINISSFNLRMAKYEMKVQILSENKDLSTEKTAPIDVNINSNWIGGQQAIIYPKNFNFNNGNMTYIFRISITALDNGAFNLEATSANTIIPLSSSTLRFDTISKETPLCYGFEIDQTTKSSDTIVHVKSVNGAITVYVQEDKLPDFDDYSKKFEVESDKEAKVEIKSSSAKKWYLCMHSEDHSYYTVHIFTQEKKENVEGYKNLLFTLLNSKEMYSIPSMHGYRLNSVSKNNNSSRRLLIAKDDKPQPIHITGNGVAGFFVMFMMIAPLIMVLGFMNDIFVNTKLVEKPLLVGKIDS